MPDQCEQAAYRSQQDLKISILHVQTKATELMTPSGDSAKKRCIDCNSTIPEVRLRAVPGTQRCIRCQVIFDQQQDERIFGNEWF